MKCSICGKASIVHDCRDMTYTYKGKTTIINDVEGDYCTACGEPVLDELQSERVNAAMLKFNHIVDTVIWEQEG